MLYRYTHAVISYTTVMKCYDMLWDKLVSVGFITTTFELVGVFLLKRITCICICFLIFFGIHFGATS